LSSGKKDFRYGKMVTSAIVGKKLPFIILLYRLKVSFCLTENEIIFKKIIE